MTDSQSSCATLRLWTPHPSPSQHCSISQVSCFGQSRSVMIPDLSLPHEVLRIRKCSIEMYRTHAHKTSSSDSKWQNCHKRLKIPLAQGSHPLPWSYRRLGHPHILIVGHKMARRQRSRSISPRHVERQRLFAEAMAEPDRTAFMPALRSIS